MLPMKLLPVSALMIAMISACGTKDKDNDNAPVTYPDIPLNTAADLIGSWQQCTLLSDLKSTSAVYTFGADGSLAFKSEVFQSENCAGSVLARLDFKGSYIVGAGNALDLTFPTGKPEDKQFTTQYRVFSVQGTTLLISNNLVGGSDAGQRDLDLNANALRMTAVAP